MARYKISFTFSGQPANGDTLRIDAPGGTQVFIFNFYTQGSGVPATNPVLIDPGGVFQATIYNLSEAFRVAYNLSGTYVTSRGADIYDIEGEFAVQPVEQIGITNMTTSVTLVVDAVRIISWSFSENATNACSLIDIDIVGSSNFNELLAPYTDTFANTTTYTVTGVDRSRVINVQVKDSNGAVAIRNIQTPSYLNAGLIEINVQNNTLIVGSFTSLLNLEYSLDNQNWQTDNTFNGLTNGDYTLYVRDQYGCQISATFQIAEGVDGVITIPTDYFLYSKQNPLRMAKRETWNGLTIHKNSRNTLACEGLEDVAYQGRFYVKTGDTINLSIKSNYSDLAVRTTNDSASQTLVQKTANMGVRESMDCKLVDLENNVWGVYFISGKRYNYDSGADLLDDYVLNGGLPQFATVGGIITIGGFNYTIDNISYNDELDVDQLEINSTALTAGDSIVKAVYDAFPYEVYEVAINPDGRPDFQVEIYFNGAVQYISEIISRDDISENLVKIEWEMYYNTDLFWATGFKGEARAYIDKIDASLKNENEKYETDIDVIQTDSSNFEVDKIKFLPVSKEVMRHMILWLSSSVVEINGIGYVKDAIEIEQLGRSNLYVLTATMIIRGSGLAQDSIGRATSEIPDLIQTGDDEYIQV